MTRFLFSRAMWLALTLWGVFTVSFFLMRAVPGGPFDEEHQLPASIQARIEAKFHLDEPLWKQYLRHLGAVLRGDLGPSYRLPDYTVLQVIGEGFPKSALLGALALGFALASGVAAGAIAAARRGRWADTSLMFLASLGLSLPNFVIAGLLIVPLCFTWQLLPAAGWGGFRELILPSFCLGAPFAASIARLTRTGLLEVLAQDYIRTAHAKGLAEHTVVLRHALRLALLPVLSFLGPAAAGILTGSLVIERVFAIPGMGSHFIQAALSRDYTLSMGVVLLFTLLVGLFNIAVDISYRVFDPRVRIW